MALKTLSLLETWFLTFSFLAAPLSAGRSTMRSEDRTSSFSFLARRSLSRRLKINKSWKKSVGPAQVPQVFSLKSRNCGKDVTHVVSAEVRVRLFRHHG